MKKTKKNRRKWSTKYAYNQVKIDIWNCWSLESGVGEKVTQEERKSGLRGHKGALRKKSKNIQASETYKRAAQKMEPKHSKCVQKRLPWLDIQVDRADRKSRC